MGEWVRNQTLEKMGGLAEPKLDGQGRDESIWFSARWMLAVMNFYLCTSCRDARESNRAHAALSESCTRTEACFARNPYWSIFPRTFSLSLSPPPLLRPSSPQLSQRISFTPPHGLAPPTITFQDVKRGNVRVMSDGEVKGVMREGGSATNRPRGANGHVRTATTMVPYRRSAFEVVTSLVILKVRRFDCQVTHVYQKCTTDVFDSLSS